MTTPAEPRLFPRWVHAWAVATVVVCTLLLVLGGLVTTFRVGMADPIWPTQPWALATINWQEEKAGYLIEHTHRLFGFLAGGFVSILAIGVWLTDRNKASKFAGLIGLVAFLALFGQLHGKLLAQNNSPDETVWPLPVIYSLLGAFGFVLLLAVGRWFGGAAGGGTRVVAVVALAAVMVQGLLGGVRVIRNAIAGSDLAFLHGSFAQIVFGLLIAVAVLTRRPGPVAVPEAAYRKLRWQTICLVLFSYTQIVFGAWIRHAPDPVGNRLHLFFAFVVVGFATLVIKQAFSDPESKAKLKFPAFVLMGLVFLQVGLGVEAWVGKFLGVALPELDVVTAEKAVVRSLHAHTGTWILAVSLIIALLARKNRAAAVGPTGDGSVNWKTAPRPESLLAGTAGTPL